MSGTLRLNDTTFATETNGNITTNVSELKINDQTVIDSNKSLNVSDVKVGGNTVIDSNKSLNVSDVKVGGNTVIDSNRKMTGVDIVPTTNFTFRNKIINGNLKSARVINQRGASSITGATGYTYDRWYYDGSTYLYQGIEDLNVNNGTYCVSWVGSDITAEYLLSTDTTANNGWDGVGIFQTVTNGGTFTVNESPEHGKHLWIRFSGTLSNLDKVMVEEGTVPTPFEQRPYGIELALCQRYYEKSFNLATAPANNTSETSVVYTHVQSGYGTMIPIFFKVPKRAAGASVIIYNPYSTTANRAAFIAGLNDAFTYSFVRSITETGFYVQNYSNPVASPDYTGAPIAFNWSAQSEL